MARIGGLQRIQREAKWQGEGRSQGTTLPTALTTITIIVQFFPAVTNDFLFHIPVTLSPPFHARSLRSLATRVKRSRLRLGRGCGECEECRKKRPTLSRHHHSSSRGLVLPLLSSPYNHFQAFQSSTVVTGAACVSMVRASCLHSLHSFLHSSLVHRGAARGLRPKRWWEGREWSEKRSPRDERDRRDERRLPRSFVSRHPFSYLGLTARLPAPRSVSSPYGLRLFPSLSDRLQPAPP